MLKNFNEDHISRYIRGDNSIDTSRMLYVLGLIELGIYIATTFPGTRLFVRFPVQSLVLYAFLAQSILIIANQVKDKGAMSPYSIWTLLFLTVCTLTYLISEHPGNTGALYNLFVCLFISICIYVYVNDYSDFNIICWIYVLIAAVNSLIFFATGVLKLEKNERLGENIGTNANTLATFLMYAVIYAIWLLLTEKKRSLKIALYFILLVAMYPLLLTGGRKFIIVPILFLVLFLLLKQKENVYSRRFKVIIAIIAIFTLGYFIIMQVPSIYNSLGIRMEQLLNSYTGAGEVDMSTQARSNMRKLAIQGWLESPIWGIGFDSFKYYSVSHGMGFTYSHSNITEMLCDGGIIQFLACYSLYLYIFLNGLKKHFNDSFRWFCVAAVIVQVVFDYGGVSYTLLHPHIFLLMAYKAVQMSFPQDSSASQTNSKGFKYVL